MAAYMDRQRMEAQILAIAFHEPNKISDVLPERRKRFSAGRKWWGENAKGN